MINNLIEAFKMCAYQKHSEHVAETGYFLNVSNDELSIYFTGCNTATQWLRMFNMKLVKYTTTNAKYRICAGVKDGFDKFVSVFDNLISNTNIKKINIYGYSYGGAIAILCHDYAIFKRPDIADNIKTIAFESPKIFRKLDKKYLTRFDNLLLINMKKSIVSKLYLGNKNPGKIIILKNNIKKLGLEAHYPENILKELYQVKLN